MYGGPYRASVRKDAEEQGNEVNGFRNTALELSQDDFGTVIVQLKALGLLQRSDRKRSITDKGTYWTLTPFGETHLTTLRAIHRESTTNASDAVEEIEGQDHEPATQDESSTDGAGPAPEHRHEQRHLNGGVVLRRAAVVEGSAQETTKLSERSLVVVRIGAAAEPNLPLVAGICDRELREPRDTSAIAHSWSTARGRLSQRIQKVDGSSPFGRFGEAPRRASDVRARDLCRLYVPELRHEDRTVTVAHSDGNVEVVGASVTPYFVYGGRWRRHLAGPSGTRPHRWLSSHGRTGSI